MKLAIGILMIIQLTIAQEQEDEPFDPLYDPSYDLSKKIDFDFKADLVPMIDYVPSHTFGENDPVYYPPNLRVLNCWECFEAEGRMCIEKNGYHTA